MFFSYNPKLEKEYITKEERDNFDASPLFLEIFHEQKDYFVENYGLSIGWILVEKVPEIGDNADKLMFAYEWDVYVKEEVKSSVKLLQTYIIPIVIAVGITEWKSSPHEKGDISDTAIANIVTTWRLMEEDE